MWLVMLGVLLVMLEMLLVVLQGDQLHTAPSMLLVMLGMLLLVLQGNRLYTYCPKQPGEARFVGSFKMNLIWLQQSQPQEAFGWAVWKANTPAAIEDAFVCLEGFWDVPFTSHVQDPSRRANTRSSISLSKPSPAKPRCN